jgi:uncharacterized protein YkwD
MVLISIIQAQVFGLVSGLAQTDNAKNASYLSAVEQEIVAEVNFARTNSPKYAAFIEEVRRNYDGKRLIRDGELPLVTQEGAKAADEAIRFLRKQKPLAALTASRGMSLAARDHVKDQGPRGKTGHDGSDRSQPWDRVSRYGTWKSKTAENISYGHSKARDIVIALIIDDGVRNRGHRKNIFDPEFRVIGVAVGPHAKFGRMCVMTFAGGFVEKGEKR